jgi:hypothetical protein
MILKYFKSVGHEVKTDAAVASPARAPLSTWTTDEF